ncbi:MAG: hypothetical protein R2731_13740 [Nocardioides sp.]
MTRQHSLLEVASLVVVGLAGILTTAGGLGGSWSLLVTGLVLVALTVAIWRDGPRATLAVLTGLALVLAGFAVRGPGLGLVAGVLLLVWLGELVGARIRQRDAAADHYLQT